MDAQNELITFAENLKLLRQQHKISIPTLSQQTGIPEKILLEVDQHIFSDDLDILALIALCKYFHLKPSEFFLPLRLDAATE